MMPATVSARHGINGLSMPIQQRQTNGRFPFGPFASNCSGLNEGYNMGVILG